MDPDQNHLINYQPISTMTSSNVDSLLTSITTLAGVGDKTAAALHRLGCNSLIDLIFHLPASCSLNIFKPDLRYITEGINIITIAKVEYIDDKVSHFTRSKKFRFKIICGNDTGTLTLSYFNFYPQYLVNKLKIGDEIAISGKVEKYGGFVTIPHPDYVLPASKIALIPRLEVIYPLSYGLVNKQIIKLIKQALDALPELPEWLPSTLLRHNIWPSFKASLMACHHPHSHSDLEPLSAHRRRLAFDELLAYQLMLKMVRATRHKAPKQPLKFSGNLNTEMLQGLSFHLTKGQQEAVDAIGADQRSSSQMMRLLQGDVGSGKTVVALCAMLNAVEADYQSALMAPTDILANQHYMWICKVTSHLDLKIALLTGKTPGKARIDLLEKLAVGDIDILVGTHAIFQEGVEFYHLALAVIDEQHRFGVKQRLALSNKHISCDVLVMSATPIPRTLTLALYSDMEISRLEEKPAGRLPIITSIMPVTKAPEVIHSFIKLMKQGEKIYWICPLVEESEESELKAAIARFNELKVELGDQVGLIHGRMPIYEKDDVLKSFIEGHIQVLVATTVIEVGIDVKDASIIIIEHAERFGLAQLHQLRGRVGRGDKQSYCILLYGLPISNNGKARLQIMRSSNDGFVIAEEDLRLRGAGEILGTKQSGLPNFRFADLSLHQDLLNPATELASQIINNDPMLQKAENQHFKLLLQLFGYCNINVKG